MTKSPDSHVPSPAHRFENLDPALQDPATIFESILDGTSPPTTQNRLEDFAQHVLSGHEDPEFNHEDAGELFSGDHSRGFEGLLTAARSDEKRTINDAVPSDYTQGYHETETESHAHAHAQTAQDILDGEDVEGEHHGSNGPRFRARKRKRDGELVEGDEGENLDPVKMKKDSHVGVHDVGEDQVLMFCEQKEVERRRRENINDGINEIARLVPNLTEKQMGKGTVLRRAAEYISELKDKIERIDEDAQKRDVEKAELEKELDHTQIRLSDERGRSLRYETSWREAEDRAASSQFELERVKTELERLKGE
ncbi:hypothetical protein P7C73_g5798, partial [Tremellales sp. Uapishka_1]